MAAGVDLNAALGVIAQVALFAVPILAAIVFHEVAHGAMAYALGDPTAAERGRLTLNPLPHIDPIGSVLLPGLLLVSAQVLGAPPMIFGWARPVPVDVRRLGRPRRDAVLVALAGPGTNLLLAALSAMALAVLPAGPEPGSLAAGLQRVAAASVVINCVLAIFNLLPVPPLDGGRVLTAILPARTAWMLGRLEGLGMLIVVLVALNTNVVSRLVRPLVDLLFRLAGVA